jgi:twitching motility protein PilT
VISQRLLPRIGGGMVAAFELLIANNPVRSLVREGKTHQIRNVLAAGRAEGMCTLETWLNHLIANGLVTYEDAVSRSSHPKELRPPAGAPQGSYAAVAP